MQGPRGTGGATTHVMEGPICAGCGSPGATKRCSRCRSVYFCDEDCLGAGWKKHKKVCKALATSAAAAAKGAGKEDGRTHVMQHASEGKDPDGPAGGDAKDNSKNVGGVGEDGGENKSETATGGRCDALQAMMQDESFDINTTECGPNRRSPLDFALGHGDEPIDEEAVKMVLAVLCVDTNATDKWGETFLRDQCAWGRSRNVVLLLADARVDPNLTAVNGATPLYSAANLSRDRCVELLSTLPHAPTRSSLFLRTHSRPNPSPSMESTKPGPSKES